MQTLMIVAARSATGRCAAGVAALIAWLGSGAEARASWTVTNLHPAGATYSEIRGTTGTQQAGRVTVGNVIRASLWGGSADSWVDLSPAGSDSSQVWRTFGTQQVGRAFVGGVQRASLWSGSAASWVDLHPAGVSASLAWATSGTEQVGRTIVGGVMRAALWSGTAASWVDLHPAGATFSQALSTSGTEQVGQAIVGGATRASLWSGSAASWVDLSAFLSGSWAVTYAGGIWTDGTTTHIAGYGYNNDTERFEALLWTRVIPAPGAAVLLGLGGLLAPDGRRRR